MKLLQFRSLILLSAAIVASGCSLAQAQTVRTLNLDFGGTDYLGFVGAGIHVGDDGVLSSPGGTFWNVVDGHSQGELLDEFGQSFGLAPVQFVPVPDIITGGGSITQTTQSGTGPLIDSLRFEDGMRIFIRELSTSAPFDMVVYLTTESTIELNYQPEAYSNTLPQGMFPGIEGQDYLRFEDLHAYPTTIGDPMMPGVNLHSSEFNPGPIEIAAIQIRGVFVSTPEPSTAVIACLASVGLFGTRRRRQSVSSLLS